MKFWARPTTEFGEATFTVTVSHSGEKTVASEGLIGVCGPRIEAKAVAADSVETRWEHGEESKATDGDPATYWHSQYVDANAAKLPAPTTPASGRIGSTLKIGDGSAAYDVCARHVHAARRPMAPRPRVVPRTSRSTSRAASMASRGRATTRPTLRLRATLSS